MAKQPVTLIITCEQYSYLVPGCEARIRKHAPFLQPITVIMTEPNPQIWSDSVRRYIEKMDDELFTVILEDCYLTRDCLPETFEFCVKTFEHPEVMKFDLSQDRTRFPHIDLTELVIQSTQDARYRSSLQLAIWRREYLLKLLKPHRDPWEFELMGEKECMNDGAVILGLRTGVLEYDNLMLKGKQMKLAPQ